MIKDITQQWSNLLTKAREINTDPNGIIRAVSVWNLLEEFQAVYIPPADRNSWMNAILVEFPSEKAYTMFLLKWS